MSPSTEPHGRAAPRTPRSAQRPLSSLATSAAAHGAVVALAFVALHAQRPAEEDGGPTRRTALLTFRPEERALETTPAEAREEAEPLAREERDPTEDVLVEPLEVVEPAPAPAPLPPPPAADPRRFDGAPAARVARRSGATNLDLGPRERVAEAPAVPPAEPPTEVPEAPPEEAEPAPPAEVATSPSPLPGACPPPAYPRRAERLRWEGTVVLDIDVAADGSVAAARVAESSGHELLDEAALRAVRGWRFQPATRGGAAVPMALRKPIEFRLP